MFDEIKLNFMFSISLPNITGKINIVHPILVKIIVIFMWHKNTM